MPLERQSIEKKDFPIGHQGYDPEAVDAHLTALADEVEELKRSSRRRVETLASSASEQVRAIVDAAETSAANIQRQAEEDAQEIRSEANEEARATREQAMAQARDYVGKVSESTTTMLERLNAMESELGALTEALRTGTNRLNADVQLLAGSLRDVHAAAAPPRFEPEANAASSEAASAAPEAPSDKSPFYEAAPEAAAGEVAGTPVDSTAAAETGIQEFGEPVETHPPADAATTEAAAGGGSDDKEGARLIALNMALNGTPREETERYLAENFQLDDRGALLDEVYASVEG